jgi:multimeric flavodoxin WrbA
MKITAIVGTYRKGGVVDSAVEEILVAARDAGAETEKIYLLDQHIEFCTNCRACTQAEGTQRGPCPIDDDMNAILDKLEHSDAIVLASPMNCWTMTAMMKQFIERAVGYVYWPWGATGFPKNRAKKMMKRAVVVGASAAPAWFARLMTHMVGQLKGCARLFGAKTVGVLFVGLASLEPKPALSDRVRKKARRLGKKLAVRGPSTG